MASVSFYEGEQEEGKLEPLAGLSAPYEVRDSLFRSYSPLAPGASPADRAGPGAGDEGVRGTAGAGAGTQGSRSAEEEKPHPGGGRAGGGGGGRRPGRLPAAVPES